MEIIHSKKISFCKRLFKKIFIQKTWQLFIQRDYSFVLKISYCPGQHRQCKLGTFCFISQEFGGKSKKNGTNSVTRFFGWKLSRKAWATNSQEAAIAVELPAPRRCVCDWCENNNCGNKMTFLHLAKARMVMMLPGSPATRKATQLAKPSSSIHSG